MQLRPDGFPRRSDLLLLTPIECEIRNAQQSVEAAGAHPLLTEVSNLLGAARDKMADFVELPENQNAPIAVPAEPEERMLKWFTFNHLPVPLRTVSSFFWDAACKICAVVPGGPERTVSLRKLLEAKDAAVRAAVHPEG